MRRARAIWWACAHVLAVGACAHRPSESAPAPVCAPAEAQPPAGRLRIDGWFGSRVNDSLVIVVDGTERWRGMYRLCSEAPASSTGVVWLPSTPDSIRSVYIARGAEARRLYRIGGTSPSAMVIETARKPAISPPAP